MLNSAGGAGGHGGHEGGPAPPGGYNGIQSTMNRKEKRFFQKKDLQLQTTIRKGKNNNMYILSPDQIKFNQGNLQKRFEEAEIDLSMQNNFNGPSRRANSNNPTATGGHQAYNPPVQPQRKNSQSMG